MLNPFETKTESCSPSLIPFAVCGLVAWALNSSTTMSAPRESANARKAEELYNHPGYDRRDLLIFLKEKLSDNPCDDGVLWRLARAAYDVSGLDDTSAPEKKELIYYARDIIQQALDMSDQNFAVHKWFGIILSSIGDYEGSKVSISNSFIVKDHWEKAIALNPQDATSHHLLGRWSLTIAEISWIERKVAAAIFGSPPTATYAEALAHFVRADKISPGFWKKNTFMIAQTCLKMKRNDEAKVWLEKTIASPSKTDEDKQVQIEAESLRAKLGF